jgi:hypothetical protein
VQKFLSREAHERTEIVGQKQGLLYINPQKPWPRDMEMEAQLAWLPPDWVEERNGKRQVIASRRERMPRHYVVGLPLLESDEMPRMRIRLPPPATPVP